MAFASFGRVSTRINKTTRPKEDNMTKLINAIKSLDINDQFGFDNKIESILDVWRTICFSNLNLIDLLDIVCNTAYNDPELATKLIAFMSIEDFMKLKIHDQYLRFVFIRKLQDDADEIDKMFYRKPKAFENYGAMVVEFYCKARYANGEELTFLIPTIIKFLELLLHSKNVNHISLFTTYFYLSGKSVSASSPKDWSELVNKIRFELVTEESKSKRVWLTLALDFVGSKYGELPESVHSFYTSHLGPFVMTNFKISKRNLCVDPSFEPNEYLAKQKGEFNVLTVSNLYVDSNYVLDSSSGISSLNSSCNSWK